MNKVFEIVDKEGVNIFFIKCIRKILSILNPIYVSICPFKIQNNKVVFMNFLGLGYGFDPKYIAEELKSDKNLDLVWVIRNSKISNIPPEVRTVIYKSAKYYYEISTAKVWVDDARKDKEIRKRKGQYYLQTYHGFYPVKKFEKDAIQALSKDYIKCAKNDSRMIDLLVSSCEFRTKILKNNFWYNGEIAKCGCPRMRVLMNRENTKGKIYERYNMPNDSKLLVYAPTFRNSKSLKPYNIDFNLIKCALKKRFGSEFSIIVRLHPGMRGMDIEDHFGRDIINGSDYEDSEEMFAACDILISDYSDTSFAASIANKLVFIYASDLEEYKKERNLYYDLYSLPFNICINNQELIKAIEDINIDEYLNRIQEFWQKQGLYNTGDPAKYLAEWVKDKISK